MYLAGAKGQIHHPCAIDRRFVVLSLARRGYGPAREEDECGMAMDADSDSAGHNTGDTDAFGQGTSGSGLGAADPRSLAQDWIAIWQSELSAMAADPEQRETWQAVVALWTGTLSTLLSGLTGTAPHDSPAGRAGPANAPGSAPADAAPDARDAEIGRLARHVADLERRLAGLERSGHPGVDAKRRPRGKRGR